MSWEDYVIRQEESRDWEPREPEIWMKFDRLWPLMREFAGGGELNQFENRIGWTFAAWTRLRYEDRLSVLLERLIVASLIREGTFRNFSDFFAVGV